MKNVLMGVKSVVLWEKYMRILLIDDKEEELQKAKVAAEEKGWTALAVNPTIQDLSGNYYCTWQRWMEISDVVVTDLMWDHIGQKPVGLMVVIHALSLGKPVVVCTNADECDGHHSEAISFIYDGYLQQAEKPAFGWIENKDWNQAMIQIERRYEQKK